MQPTSPEPSSGVPSRKRRVLLSVVVIPLVTAAGLEVGARVIERTRGRPWDAAVRRADLASECRSLSRRAFVPGGLQDEERARNLPTTQVLQPYTGWEHMSTQELLVLGTEHYSSVRADRALDICILGGSVAQAFAEQGRARLVELVQHDARVEGREILVHDYACAGYKQPQQLMMLSYLIALGHKPDLVIELDGFNDTALAWANRALGMNPAYPYLPFWSNVLQGQRADWEWAELMHATHANQDRALEFGEKLCGSRWLASCFVGQMCIAHFESLRAEYVAAYEKLHDYIASRPKDAELKGPRFSSDEDVAARGIIRVWEESSLCMNGICAQHGIAYLHVMQPTLCDDGSKTPSAKELAASDAEKSWIEGVKKLYSPLRAAGKRLQQRGVAFFDATGIFRDEHEDLYVDVCHLNQHGNELMAEAIAGPALDALAHKN